MTPLPVIVLPSATKDAAKAADWYERQQPELRQQFLDEVDAAI